MSQQQFTSAFAYGQGNAAPGNYGMPQNMHLAYGQDMYAPFDMGANDNAGLPYGQNNQALDNAEMPHNGNWGYGPNLAAPFDFGTVNNQGFDNGQGNAALGPFGMPQTFVLAFEQPLADPAGFELAPEFVFENGDGLPALTEDEMGMLIEQAPFDTVNLGDLRQTGNAPPPALPPEAPRPAAQQPEMAQQGQPHPAAALTPPPALPAAAGAFPGPQPAQPTPGYYPAQDNMAAQQPGNYIGVSDTVPTNGAGVFGPPAPNDMVPAAASQAQGQVGVRLAGVTPEQRAEYTRASRAMRDARRLGRRRPRTVPPPAPPRVERKTAHPGPQKSRHGCSEKKAWGNHTRFCGENDECKEDCWLKVYWPDLWEKECEHRKIISDEGEEVFCQGLWSFRYRDRNGYKGKPRARDSQE